MNRPLLIRCDNHPYHISSRAIDGRFFPLPLDQVWEIMVKELYQTHLEYKLAIHAFILMGNHFHLLCHTPRSNIDEAMQSFKRKTSIKIGKWEPRYKWSLISSQTHYYQVYRYIMQNPVRAGIVSRVEEYTFSTLKTTVPFPIHSSISMSFGGQEGEILWLNEKFDQEDLELIKLGLRKGQFDVNRRRLKAFSRLSLPPVDTPKGAR